jgi:hypothetical protein
MIDAISRQLSGMIELQNGNQRLWVDNNDFAAEFRGATVTSPGSAEKAVEPADSASTSTTSATTTTASGTTPTITAQQAATLSQQTDDGLTLNSAVPSGGTTGVMYGGAWIAPGAPAGQLFPTLYPQLLSNGQPDFDPAHGVADVMYADDYYADPQAFNPAAEQAKYSGMSDTQIMAAYMPAEQAFLNSSVGKPFPAGANTDPATGLPYNQETSAS